MTITINLEKAKSIAHDKRRAARSEEFKPLDIKATIPSEAVAAEASRQLIRDKYTVMQTEINAAGDVVVLKSIVEGM
jgi:hypothetical protein